MRIHQVQLYQLDLPLRTPYVVSTRSIYSFDPLVVRIQTDSGEQGWGEVLIAKRYSHETLEGAWTFCLQQAQALLGLSLADAHQQLSQHSQQHPGATSAMLLALDMLALSPILYSAENKAVPLLAPVQARSFEDLPEEIETLLDNGFRTLKVKVGFDWEQDLRKVERIQELVHNRALLRLDANQSYSRSDAKQFAQRLSPDNIELLEQPCAADDWAVLPEIAALSTVPLMLDESIYGTEDIMRAASIEGVAFIKLKLKKIGSVQALIKALELIRQEGMEPVLGDGVGSDICCWAEAMVAALAINGAGEMNGFLKTQESLFERPLTMHQGNMLIPAQYQPLICHTKIARLASKTSEIIQ